MSEVGWAFFYIFLMGVAVVCMFIYNRMINKKDD